MQWLFVRDSVIFKRTTGPRFFSAVFLPKYKSTVSLAKWYQNLKPHLIGLFLTYCLKLDWSLTFTTCSSIIWESSFETELLKLLLLTLSLLSFFCVVRKMLISQNIYKTWSSHNISNALVIKELFTFPITFVVGNLLRNIM